RPRAVAIGVTGGVLAHAVVTSFSYQHFTYYVAFLPVLIAIVCACVTELGRVAARLADVHLPRALACAAIAVYGLAPFVNNASTLFGGNVLKQGDYSSIDLEAAHAAARLLQEQTPPDSVIV